MANELSYPTHTYPRRDAAHVMMNRWAGGVLLQDFLRGWKTCTLP